MMTDNLKKLNCNNYQVNLFSVDKDFEGHYYIQTGLRGLYSLCKESQINFKELCLEILEKGYGYNSEKTIEVCLI